MSDDLLTELRRRVEVRRAAGDYELDWLDAEVEQREPVNPVDHYLQTPPTPTGRAARLLGAGTEDEVEQRLREAIAWLKLAHDAEQRAREGIGAAAVVTNRRRAAALGGLAEDVRALGAVFDERLHQLEDGRRWTASAALRAIHADLVAPGATPLDLESAECRAYSQNGEDGIILHLLSLIGPASRRFVEIGVEDGRQCNTANLAMNFGWSGVMIDRDAAGVASAREFYGSQPRTRDAVRVIERHVTRESDRRLAGGGRRRR